MPDPVDLKAPGAVARALRDELDARFPGAIRGYAAHPVRSKGGMEAAVFFLQLDAPDLDDMWQQPLVMRLPRSAKSDHDPSKEVQVQTFLASKGFPTARPLAYGRRDSALGRPWLLMERLRILDPKTSKEHRKTTERVAEFQSQLHELDTDGWPLPAEGALVDRRLESMSKQVHAAGPRARATFDWLADHAHVVHNESRSVLHNDFMGNVLVTQSGRLAAIDWATAEVGDYHDDVARTVNLISLVPIVLPLPGIRDVAGLALTGWARKYRDAYATFRELDPRRLRYWAAMHTAEWALMFSHGAAQLYDQRPHVATRRVSGWAETIAWRLRDRFWSLVRTRADRPL